MLPFPLQSNFGGVTISELQISDTSDEVLEIIEILRRIQLVDMEKASRLLLMARVIQNR
ncbi:hypothetical protein Tco_0101098, partial [Tanacetum coccineum]